MAKMTESIQGSRPKSSKKTDTDGKSKKRKERSETSSPEAPTKAAKTAPGALVKPVVEPEVADEVNPEQFRREHQIAVTGRDESGTGVYKPPAPMLTFASTPFAPAIRRALDNAGFASPTPTQCQAWPIALSGRDVITVARTGSGKTCGFLLPAFHRLLATPNRRRGPPAILVLAPTRELACQIEEECVKFGRGAGMRSTCAYGGAPKSLQIRTLRAGVEVLIATPGRLNDLIEMGAVDLSSVSFMVLDEADRMLDMGFEPQIRSIIATLPSSRQTMMFTATWPKEVQALAREFLINPVEVKFGESNVLNANKSITQIIKVVRESDKAEHLMSVLKELNPAGEPAKVPKTIIFLSRKWACDQLANNLWDAGYSVDTLHGDKQQYERTKVMDQFKRSQLRLLIATDVAARGLDVKDIEVVINYDFPNGSGGVEDYVHRIGRTARGACTEGKAVTFFTDNDAKNATKLIGVLQRSGQAVPDELRKFAGSGGGGGGFKRGFGGNNNRWGGGGGGRGGGGRRW